MQRTHISFFCKQKVQKKLLKSSRSVLQNMKERRLRASLLEKLFTMDLAILKTFEPITRALLFRLKFAKKTCPIMRRSFRAFSLFFAVVAQSVER